MQRGSNLVGWDGRGDDGAAVTDGLYLVGVIRPESAPYREVVSVYSGK